MLINVALTLEKGELPLDYRRAFVSLFKSVLERSYPELYREYYESGPVRKSFCFSVALPEPVFGKELITLGGCALKLSISSSDEREAVMLYNAFQRNRGFRLPLASGNSMTVGRARVDASPVVSGTRVEIHFLSPLAVRLHERGEPDKYYIYDDDEFEESLNMVVSGQLGKEVRLRLTPVAAKKTVVLSFGVKIRASIGTYLLEAEPEVINILLKSGIGSRRNEGFGHFTVVGR